ncbi:hypothetical protein C0J50_11104 [Silurus asotus]|uniref:1-alkyl-2-acetylglycerophosphocholine esterase n=1 Tax=Silurus asotus TaxID=30991 RepID=A0AAD5ADM9_SILAS|nr:hypothetical protein C0J50_11104 [Silurus asotus]
MNHDRRPRVWLIGSSIIARLRSYLSANRLDKNLGLKCDIIWDGRGGRRWEHLLPLLHEKRAATHTDPDVIIIHLGGNSIGLPGTNRVDLMCRMKADIHEAHMLFPNSKIMFSDILPRRVWRHQTAASGYGMERTRRWLNGVMSGYMRELGMRCIHHREIGLEQLDQDGVHLNVEGNMLFEYILYNALSVEFRS